jgi:hypothetical protein
LDDSRRGRHAHNACAAVHAAWPGAVTVSPHELFEIEHIKRVKYRYLRGLDTGDLALLASLFTPDVSARFYGGSYDVAIEGRTQLLEFLAASSGPEAVMHHNCHHPEIDLTGPDSATGRWYLTDWTYNRVQKRATYGTAFYEDSYARMDGAWRIRRTGYQRLFEIVDEGVPLPHFTANLLGSKTRSAA